MKQSADDFGHYCFSEGHPKVCRWCDSKLVIVVQARICETCDNPPKEKKKHG